ncbi:DUF4838 domain-containing protein [Paenibacillus contaminans]|uniref:SLH domain-containing protein n=1 Tax=Paenibacillus contaminans TaxID=450362 RepID=A0A329MGD6_9BACL|nr:DUF4838 domain-containing protein [Paenibacillus contaminans]RAV17733.1 hypothetical protein DQG23_26800 [Paenibacillus contaminans]
MRLKRWNKQLFSMLLIVCLVFSTFGTLYAAANNSAISAASASTTSERTIPSDVIGHWAEKEMLEWLIKGLIHGYEDHTFKPDNEVTRGEFLALVNRSFGFTEEAAVTFDDVKSSDWEYQDVAKAVKAGYIQGYADGTIGAGRQISREEAAVIIARLLHLSQTDDPSAVNGFKDAARISGWSRMAVGALQLKDIMKGYEDGSFRPEASITRAEAVVSLDRALKQPESNVLDTAGLYGPAEGMQTITGDVIVRAAGVKLRNMTITGNLLLAEGIGEGDVYLQGVTVKGKTTVQGGGRNSIHFEDSVLVTVIVDKKDGTVRIVAEGTTVITEVVLLSPAILEESGATGEGFTTVTLTSSLPDHSKVTLLGTFENVDVAADYITVELPKGTIGRLNVSDLAAGFILNIGSEGNVLSLILDAVIQAIGQGKIVSATISEKARASTFEKQPDKKDGAGASSTPTPVPDSSPGGNSTPEPTPIESKLTAASAVNGMITVSFNNAPAASPAIEQFTVLRSIDEASAVTVVPTAVEWVAASKTAKLTVPLVPNGESAQAVSYSVAYNQTAALHTAPFHVAAAAGSISGIVKGADLAPLGGVTVVLAGRTSGTTVTDENGKYTFADVLAGTDYSVQASKEGYKTGSLTGIAVSHAEDTVLAVIALTLFVPAPQSGTVTGIVYGTNMGVLSGASVTVTGSVYSGLTDDRGIYIIQNVPIGEHTITVSKTGYADGVSSPFLVADGGTTVVDVTLIEAAPPLLLVSNGEALSLVVVADGAPEQTVQAAHTLADYVRKSTGVLLPVMSEAEVAAAGDAFSGKVRIYVGTTSPEGDPHITAQLEALLGDGYVIHPHGQTLTIIGPKAIGTEYGVYEFLERYVGVRWLLPGEYGEDVPQHAELAIPLNDVRDQPAYLSRVMYPLQYVDVAGNNPIRYEWGVRNRLRNQNNGWDHNVWSFIHPDLYKETHPEFFPQKDGKPYIPALRGGWQPCFSNAATIQIAVDWIIDYFSKNPDEESMSLAVNDSGNFCEADPSHPKYTGKLNSLGRPDMSDIYYEWVNQVAEKVLEVFPDKWFGVLAYQEVYDPPSFKLNDRVVPYLTKDRMAWSDAAVRAEDQQIVDKWNEKAAYIGFYDYIYANPYTLPRVYNQLMADNLKYGKNNNAIAFFGELNPNWGEGPKTWLISKLLWNPDQDADDLLNEWYERAVGTESAPYLKLYFDHWSDFWENRIQQTDWFQSRKRIVYFMYDSAAYLSIVTAEEIAQSRVWLETALDKALTTEQKARAQMLLDAFGYFEASALSYPKPAAPLTNTQDALELLEQSVDFKQAMDYADKRIELVEQFKDDPVLYHSVDPQSINLVWSGLNATAFWRLVDYLKDYEATGGPVKVRAAELAANGTSEGVRVYAGLLMSAVDEGPANRNASFEEAGDLSNERVTAKYWDANIFSYGKFERKEGFAYTGDASIYVHNFYSGDINQTVDAQPGLIISRLKYFVSADTRSVGTIWLELNLLDENGIKLATIRTDQQAFANSLGRWETIQILDRVPARVNGIPVKKVQMAAIVNGFFEGGTLYIDDFELYMANEPSQVPYLASATAENGKITVVFNKTPEQSPTAADFTVTHFAGVEPVTLTPEVVWDAASKTAVLTIPEAELKPWEQNIKYEVAYSGVDTISTNAVALPRLSGYTSVMTNTSFEQWTDGSPDGWWLWGEGFYRADTIKRSGQYSLAIDGVYPAQNAAGGAAPIQELSEIAPGHYYGVFHFMTLAETEGTLSLNVWLRDSAGNWINGAVASSSLVQAATSNGKWRTVSFEFDVLPEYDGKQAAAAQVLLHMLDFKKGERIYFDDVELIRQEDVPYLASASAENGEITVLFNKIPEQPPTAADFAVTQFAEGESLTLTPEVAWDAASKTAVLTMPGVELKPWEQSASYEVTYSGVDTISTNTVALPRLSGYTSVMTNTSFEQWTDGNPDGWWLLGEGFYRTDTVKRSGQYSLAIDGVYPAQNAAGGAAPIQELSEIAPGHYYGVFHFMTSAETEGTLSLNVWIRDSAGNWINGALASSPLVRAVTSNGKWRTVFFEFDVLPDYDGKQAATAQVFLHMLDFKRGETISFDDVELIRQDAGL